MIVSTPSSTALLIIDVQQGFDDARWGKRNHPDAEANIAILIDVWRRKEGRVIHIQHCSTEPDSPLHPDLPGCQFKPEATPTAGEPIFIALFVVTGLTILVGLLNSRGICDRPPLEVLRADA